MTVSQSASAALPATAQQFVQWGLAALRDVPPVEAQDAGGVRFDIAGTGIPHANIGGRRVVVAESDPGLFHWIVAQLQTRGEVQHAEPRSDDVTSEVLAAALVSAYDFADGEVELVSCATEPRPVLRLTLLCDAAGDRLLRHAYFWPDGEELDDALVQALRLDDLAPLTEAREALDAQRTRRWIDSTLVRERRKLEADERGELVVATLVWCRHVRGKIAFSAGASAVEVPFHGWAKLLAAGDELPPPYICPLSGASSRRLGVATDGHIAPCEALAVCDETHRRVLLSDLERCHQTQKHVVRELLAPCMASGQLVLKKLLQHCGQCHQPVAAGALQGGRCSACRSLTPVSGDDPRMARVLGEYPKLDRWSRWQLAETESTYVLATHSWVRQVLLVIHKETLSVLYASVAGRIWSPWQEMSQLQRDDLLG